MAKKGGKKTIPNVGTSKIEENTEEIVSKKEEMEEQAASYWTKKSKTTLYDFRGWFSARIIGLFPHVGWCYAG